MAYVIPSMKFWCSTSLWKYGNRIKGLLCLRLRRWLLRFLLESLTWFCGIVWRLMKKKTNLIKHTGEKTNKQQFSCVSQIYWPWISCYWSSEHIPVHQKLPSQVKTLLKVQRTQVIEYFESFNTFSSKQKLQQALKSWSNFTLFLFGKGLEIHRTRPKWAR